MYEIIHSYPPNWIIEKGMSIKVICLAVQNTRRNMHILFTDYRTNKIYFHPVIYLFVFMILCFYSVCVHSREYKSNMFVYSL